MGRAGYNEIERDILRQVGLLIAKRRRALGKTAARLAQEVGVARVTVSKIENAKQGVTVVQLWKIACKLECELASLLPPAYFDSNRPNLIPAEIDLKGKAQEWARTLFRS